MENGEDARDVFFDCRALFHILSIFLTHDELEIIKLIPFFFQQLRQLIF